MSTTVARLTTTRPRLILFVTLGLVLGALLLGRGVSDRLGSGGTEDPAAESSRAAELLEAHFPASRPNVVLLVTGADGRTVDDPAVAQQGAQLTERLAFTEDVAGVTSYFSTGAAQLRSVDSRHALVVAHLEGDEDAVGEAFEHVREEFAGPQGDLVVSLGGAAAVREEIQSTIEEDLRRSELLALPLTLLVLVVVFGSVVAALLPLAVGVVAVLGTNAALRVITEFADVSIFAQNLTTALGLGLAIDYALFIVRRYREELHAGETPAAAVAATLRTAGRTVVFSAATVAVALAAMLVFPLYFLRSFAYAGISVVVLAATAAIVVLPALLVLLGRRIDALSVRQLTDPVRRRLHVVSPRHRRVVTDAAEGGWYRAATVVMRRAPVFAVATTALLVAMGLPFADVRFGTTDDRQLPVGSESRTVQQTIRDSFAARPTGVLDVVALETDPATRAEPLVAYATEVSRLPGVAAVSTPVGTFAQGRLAEPPGPADGARSAEGRSHLSVLPAGDVEDVSPESEALVEQIRALDPPFPTYVAGAAAAQVDSRAAIGERLPIALAMIAATTLALVFLLTGSLLIPLQALVLNALSLTAMFGAVVWVFQDGNLSGLLGFTPTGSIETTLPVLMFCVAFGLSMDYGVFLLSRMHEEYERTGDNRTAVAVGLQRSGGLISAAALILAVVLVAIGTSRITNTKMLGLGVAIAVLTDAMIVRCLLVPAVMALSGRATWWAPGPLRRFQQRFGIRESGEPVPLPAAAAETAPRPAAGPRLPAPRAADSAARPQHDRADRDGVTS